MFFTTAVRGEREVFTNTVRGEAVIEANAQRSTERSEGESRSDRTRARIEPLGRWFETLSR